MRTGRFIVVLFVGFPGWHIAAQGQPSFGTKELPDSQWPGGEPERPRDPPGSPEFLSSRTSSAAASIVFGSYNIVQVSVDGMGNNIVGDAANEPSLAISPEDPRTMAIAWRQFDTVLSDFRQAGMAYSTDGGQTWTPSGPIDPGVFRSDPVLASDGAGNFYFSSLTHPEADPDSYEVTVFKSTDGGATWPTSAYAYGGDKQWMIADERTAGLGAGHLYQYWSSYVSCCDRNNFNRSINGGFTFSVPQYLSSREIIWGTLDTDPEGVLYIAGRSYDGWGHLVTRSFDARNPVVATPTFEPPVYVNLEGFTGHFGGFNGPNPAGLLGQVWIAAHPFKSGHVYILSSITRFDGDDPCDVMFARSVDGGQSWSAAIRVNDDPLGFAWQWFGTMSVAPNGRIDVTWYDTRVAGVAQISALYYSYSLDEGQTWSANQQISPPFETDIGWPQQAKLGDYMHMISDDGGANLAFAATFNGGHDVYFVRIRQDCNANGLDDDCDTACSAPGTRCAAAGCGLSEDCNGNHVPDECEPDEDCNKNSMRDLCEITVELDCNANRRIDACESNGDCNNNPVADACEAFARDCNANGVPDDCDIAGPVSTDRNADGVPDECQGACCGCNACTDETAAFCRFYGRLFSGEGLLCSEPGACELPVFAHDSCALAFEVPSAPHYTTQFDNRCAFWDPPYEVPCPSTEPFGNDLWYSYIAPCTGTVELSTCEGTDYDAIMAVYGSGTSCLCPTTNTSLLSCGDDTCGVGGGPAVLAQSVVAGQCYSVRVGGWAGSSGAGELNINYLSFCNPTDLDGSFETNLRDFAIFANCFGPLRAGCSSSDFNHDGVMDLSDYRALHAMLGN